VAKDNNCLWSNRRNNSRRQNRSKGYDISTNIATIPQLSAQESTRERKARLYTYTDNTT
ncbi:29382_t:CDS:2, partial [Gigaspora margarita]